MSLELSDLQIYIRKMNDPNWEDEQAASLFTEVYNHVKRILHDESPTSITPANLHRKSVICNASIKGSSLEVLCCRPHRQDVHFVRFDVNYQEACVIVYTSQILSNKKDRYDSIYFQPTYAEPQTYSLVFDLKQGTVEGVGFDLPMLILKYLYPEKA